MKLGERLRKTWQNIRQWLTARYQQLRRFVMEQLRRFGVLPPAPESDLPEIDVQQELPEDYVERFTLAPVVEPEQLEGRDNELQLIEKAYRQWQLAGNALLLSGEMGAGVTSLLNAALPAFDNWVFLEDDARINTRKRLLQVLAGALKLEGEVSTLEAFVKAVPEEGAPVVFFEGVERLFLRVIGGFDLLNDFIYLINQTHRRIFWIVTVNSYSHYYLDRVLDLSSNFLYIIRLAPLPAEVLREVLLYRNEGYENIYLKPGELPRRLRRRLAEADAAGKQALLREYFFERLAAFARGNLSRAMLFWIRSAVHVKESRVYLKPFEHRDTFELSYEELFVLEAILQHGALSATDLAKVLDLPGRKGQVMLGKLLERNYIFPRDVGRHVQEYEIHMLYLAELKNSLRDNLNRKTY